MTPTILMNYDSGRHILRYHGNAGWQKAADKGTIVRERTLLGVRAQNYEGKYNLMFLGARCSTDCLGLECQLFGLRWMRLSLARILETIFTIMLVIIIDRGW